MDVHYQLRSERTLASEIRSKTITLQTSLEDVEVVRLGENKTLKACVKYIWIYGTGTAYPSGAHEFTDIFVVFVLLNLLYSV